jgi:mycothiol synthase
MERRVVDVRAFQPADAPALLALLQAAGAPMTPAGLDAWLAAPGYAPLTDLFVAPAGAGRLLGARDVRLRGRDDAPAPVGESWAVLDPAAGAPVFHALLAAARARAGALIRARGRTAGVFQTRVSPNDATTRGWLEAAGLQEARRLLTMERPHLEDLPAPLWPPGITVRPYRPGDDDLAWVDAFNEAFADHWGGWMGLSPAVWRATVQRPDFQPALSLVAVDGLEIAGFCHCLAADAASAERRRPGVIRYVGVRPAWRRRGLGRALTVAGLHRLRAAGLTAASLGVDGANTTGAHRLYADLGFVTVEEICLYRVDIASSDR